MNVHGYFTIYIRSIAIYLHYFSILLTYYLRLLHIKARRASELDKSPPSSSVLGQVCCIRQVDVEPAQVLRQYVEPASPRCAAGPSPARCCGVELEDRSCGVFWWAPQYVPKPAYSSLGGKRRGWGLFSTATHFFIGDVLGPMNPLKPT